MFTFSLKQRSVFLLTCVGLALAFSLEAKALISLSGFELSSSYYSSKGISGYSIGPGLAWNPQVGVPWLKLGAHVGLHSFHVPTKRYYLVNAFPHLNIFPFLPLGIQVGAGYSRRAASNTASMPVLRGGIVIALRLPYLDEIGAYYTVYESKSPLNAISAGIRITW